MENLSSSASVSDSPIAPSRIKASLWFICRINFIIVSLKRESEKEKSLLKFDCNEKINQGRDHKTVLLRGYRDRRHFNWKSIVYTFYKILHIFWAVSLVPVITKVTGSEIFSSSLMWYHLTAVYPRLCWGIFPLPSTGFSDSWYGSLWIPTQH